MAHINPTRVRVIKRPLSAVSSWDEGWLRPCLSWLNRVRIAVGPTWSAILGRWAGIAGMTAGLLWVALSFTFLLVSPEVYSLLHPSPDWLFPVFYIGTGGTEYLAIPLALFTFALLALLRNDQVRASRLGRLGFRLYFVGLGLVVALPPLQDWLDWIWVNRGITHHYFFSGVLRTELSDWYYNTRFGLTLLLVGLMLIGISSMRVRALPTPALLSLIAASEGLLIPYLEDAVSVAILLGGEPDQLPYGFAPSFRDLLFSLGLFPILAYLFGVNWIWVGYTLHRKANHRQLATQHPD